MWSITALINIDQLNGGFDSYLFTWNVDQGFEINKEIFRTKMLVMFKLPSKKQACPQRVGVILYNPVYTFDYQNCWAICILKVQNSGENCIQYFINFHDFLRVKTWSKFVYWGQVWCEICILFFCNFSGVKNSVENCIWWVKTE